MLILLSGPLYKSPGPGLSYRMGSRLWPPGFYLASALCLALPISAGKVTGGRGWRLGLFDLLIPQSLQSSDLYVYRD